MCNNTFRGLEALSLWTYEIGVAVLKSVYNNCPLKHEVVNILMSSEMFYHEDLRSLELEGDMYKIQYNTLSSYYFHDLAEAGIPMLNFINSFSCT